MIYTGLTTQLLRNVSLKTTEYFGPRYHKQTKNWILDILENLFICICDSLPGLSNKVLTRPVLTADTCGSGSLGFADGTYTPGCAESSRASSWNGGLKSRIVKVKPHHNSGASSWSGGLKSRIVKVKPHHNDNNNNSNNTTTTTTAYYNP